LLIVIGNTCRNSFFLLWLVYRRGLRLLLLNRQSGTLSRILRILLLPVHTHGLHSLTRRSNRRLLVLLRTQSISDTRCCCRIGLPHRSHVFHSSIHRHAADPFFKPFGIRRSRLLLRYSNPRCLRAESISLPRIVDSILLPIARCDPSSDNVAIDPPSASTRQSIALPHGLSVTRHHGRIRFRGLFLINVG